MKINQELAKAFNLPKYTTEANIKLSVGKHPTVTAIFLAPDVDTESALEITGHLLLIKSEARHKAIQETLDELDKAIEKFPTWPTRGESAFAVLGEEVGELQKEIVQMTNEPHKGSKEKIKKEALQAAAMSIRFLISLDRYDYTPSEQHSQED